MGDIQTVIIVGALLASLIFLLGVAVGYVIGLEEGINRWRPR